MQNIETMTGRRVLDYCRHQEITVAIEAHPFNTSREYFEEGPPKNVIDPIVRIDIFGAGVLLSRLEWRISWILDSIGNRRRARSIILGHLFTFGECPLVDECKLQRIEWKRIIAEARGR